MTPIELFEKETGMERGPGQDFAGWFNAYHVWLESKVQHGIDNGIFGKSE